MVANGGVYSINSLLLKPEHKNWKMLMVILTSWLKYYLNIILMGYISHRIRDLHRDYKYLSLVVHLGRLMLKKGLIRRI
jgi:hypothetical protein